MTIFLIAIIFILAGTIIDVEILEKHQDVLRDRLIDKSYLVIMIPFYITYQYYKHIK